MAYESKIKIFKEMRYIFPNFLSKFVLHGMLGTITSVFCQWDTVFPIDSSDSIPAFVEQIPTKFFF